jgi:site-specific DNA recombinase
VNETILAQAPHANGHGTRRVALYLRVSTDEQAQHGYSIEDQRQELRRWAENEGVRVVAEEVDDGYSGASRDRPGLNRIIELAERGEIDTVVAAKRDRLFRMRLHRLLFDEDMKGCAVKIVALNDTNNRLADGFMDDFAEYERDMIRERTRAGKLQAARQGRIVASSAAPRYGFKYTPDRRGYLVDEPRMEHVRGIFRAVAAGQTLCGVVEDLNRRGVPSPRAGANGTSGLWATAAVRGIIRNPVYEAHSHAEVAALVAPEVAARLDESESYGLWYYADVPVPVPDPGIPRETVRAARERIKHNRKTSNMGDRTWTLSGGTLKCAVCGSAMVASTTAKRGRRYLYYRCFNSYRGVPRCENKRLLRAEETEEVVWAFVSDLFRNPEVLLHEWDRIIEAEKAALRVDPGKQRRLWASRLVELDKKKERAQDLAVEGLIDADDLRVRLARIASERANAQRELEDAAKVKGRISGLEAQRALFPEFARAVIRRLDDGLTPEEQIETYKFLNLSFEAEDGEIVSASGNFERIGYPTEEEMIQRERDAFAELEREGPVPEELIRDEELERVIDDEIRAEIQADLECVERTGVRKTESCSPTASGQP